MKITCKEDCSNAPKKQLLKEFNIAFGKGDVEGVLMQLSDDIIWEMVGDKSMKGKEEVAKELESMKDYTAVELTIDNIITHGRTAACNGSFKMNSGAQYGFCDIYEFHNNSTTAKIKRMTSYAIALKP